MGVNMKCENWHSDPPGALNTHLNCPFYTYQCSMPLILTIIKLWKLLFKTQYFKSSSSIYELPKHVKAVIIIEISVHWSLKINSTMLCDIEYSQRLRKQFFVTYIIHRMSSWNIAFYARQTISCRHHLKTFSLSKVMAVRQL